MKYHNPFRCDPDGEENLQRIRRVAHDFLQSTNGLTVLKAAFFDSLDDAKARASIRGAALGLLQSNDGHAVVRDVIRYTLGEAEARALILTVFTQSFAEERLKQDLAQEIDGVKWHLTKQLEKFKADLERELDAERAKILISLKTAREEAEAMFDGSLQEKREAAIETAQTEVMRVFSVLQGSAEKKHTELHARIESEISERAEGALNGITERANRILAHHEKALSSKFDELVQRRAEPLIRDAVHELFVNILGRSATTRMEERFDAGVQQGRSDGYRQGHAVGHREGREEGEAEGYQQGFSSGRAEGREEGLALGHRQGYDAGYQDGRYAGMNDARDAGLDELPFEKNLLRRIDTLDEFSSKTANFLRSSNIIYVGDLAQLSVPEVRRMPGCGPKCLEEIQRVLGQLGLRLGMEIPNWPPENIEELSGR